ncbi:DUF1737 domain-containing protein [bacterium]|nr:DUF1737 domain-containing protein [Betaproteobacteria bacterium]NDG32490.1 DUF1737 domain-containing protein [bacterium]NCZ83760.1 DUF1737 domain-containing protein [Betaproteobacteria bacterium]NDA06116.1 DUF1737 domain-containing protein [Betaproteobacteria bacterium]NDA56976.1 DUF1737 domain-containing protein [Betaproteobacteria bacterium]
MLNRNLRLSSVEPKGKKQAAGRCEYCSNYSLQCRFIQGIFIVTSYEIVRAPDLDVLALLVESYLDQGYSPAGGIVIDITQQGKVYIQAVYRKPEPQLGSPPEDWSEGMTKVNL